MKDHRVGFFLVVLECLAWRNGWQEPFVLPEARLSEITRRLNERDSPGLSIF